MALRGPYDSQTQFGAPTTLGERLKVLRVKAGLTQQQLAAALSTDQTLISTWERDRARPSAAALGALAQFFSSTPEALDSGEGFTLEAAAATATVSLSPPELSALPDPGNHAVLLVDEQGGAPRPLEPFEALGILMEAIKVGRKAWIVLKD
jgi:transcriptional regulator with XRE-family HTH domain